MAMNNQTHIKKLNNKILVHNYTNQKDKDKYNKYLDELEAAHEKYGEDFDEEDFDFEYVMNHPYVGQSVVSLAGAIQRLEKMYQCEAISTTARREEVFEPEVFLKAVERYCNNKITTPQSYAERCERRLENEKEWYGTQLIICYGDTQVKELVGKMLYHAKSAEANYRLCQQHIAKGCTLYLSEGSRECNRCGANYRYNGRPRIWIYNYIQRELRCLVDVENGVDLTQEDINNWYATTTEAAKEYAKEKEAERVEQEETLVAEHLDATLKTETSWLPFENLMYVHDAFNNKFKERGLEKFSEWVEDNIKAFGEDGDWDVELSCSAILRRNSSMFVTTKAANGSVALSPRRTVIVENPKLVQKYEFLLVDRLKLLLSLTYYAYAGFQPTKKVLEMATVPGYTDYYVEGDYTYEFPHEKHEYTWEDGWCDTVYPMVAVEEDESFVQVTPFNEYYDYNKSETKGTFQIKLF